MMDEKGVEVPTPATPPHLDLHKPVNVSNVGWVDNYSALDGAEVSHLRGAVLCPVHAENTPSCSVEIRPDQYGRMVEGDWYCFGCGACGDFYQMVSEYEWNARNGQILTVPTVLNFRAHRLGHAADIH